MTPKYNDDEANTFYTNIDSCVATGKPAFALTLSATVTNA
jgi:hypothetical protein